VSRGGGETRRRGDWSNALMLSPAKTGEFGETCVFSAIVSLSRSSM
jgi:hypothetical protein